MKKHKAFTIEDRLPLDRLKRARLPFSADTRVKRAAPPEPRPAIGAGNGLIANLLEAEPDECADFEQAFVKRGAERFAEWIEKELGK